MTIIFVPVEVSTFLQSRRGSNVYRRVKVPPNTREMDYNALPSCALEQVDIIGHIWARADVQENRGDLILTYLGPQGKKSSQQEFAKAEAYKAKIAKADKAEADKIRLAKIEEAKDKVKLTATVSAQVVKAKGNEGTVTPKVDSRLEKKDDDAVQQVGREHSPDGDSF